MATTLFLAEGLSAWRLLESFPSLEPVEPLIEVLLDVVVVVPLLVFLFVLPTARNIRQRERAEQALRAARDELEVRVYERTAELEGANTRLRAEVARRVAAQNAVEFQAGLLDAVEQAVAATDADGKVLYWNRYAQQLYGWRAADAVGRNLTDVIALAQLEHQTFDVLARCQSGIGWTGEAEIVRRDGTRIPAYAVCSPLAGDREGHVFLTLDISELKQAEEALRESEEKYSTLVENSATGIFIFQGGRLVFVNPRLAQLLEYSRAELTGVEPWRLVHADDRDGVRDLARWMTGGEEGIQEHECRLLTRSGQEVWVALRNTLIRHGGNIAMLGNVEDVTERKRMEMDLRRLSARLLSIQEEERRRVARDLHDSVGQTLTGIKFLVEAALGGSRPEERRPKLERLRALVPRIQDAVEEVRRISMELRPPILDDLGLVPTIAWYAREFRKAHPDLEVEERITATEADIPPGLGTPVYRILQEATTNVAKHSGATRVTIKLGVAAGNLRLRVQDDGAGFDLMGPSEGAVAGGSGLGSMRERAELSGGHFSLTSAPGAGTVVEVVWPVTRAVNA